MQHKKDNLHRDYDNLSGLCPHLLSNLPEKEFSYLNPVYGIKYTNRKDLYKYVESDISVIERDLCEYLYDFDNVDSPLYDTELISHTSRVEYNGFNHK